jgi:hypothetical protein
VPTTHTDPVIEKRKIHYSIVIEVEITASINPDDSMRGRVDNLGLGWLGAGGFRGRGMHWHILGDLY